MRPRGVSINPIPPLKLCLAPYQFIEFFPVLQNYCTPVEIILDGPAAEASSAVVQRRVKALPPHVKIVEDWSGGS
jgi:hypothetical protein